MKKNLEYVIAILIILAACVYVVSFAKAQSTEYPAYPTEIIPPNPEKGCEAATCSPVRDSWCWNWCEMETVSKADVRHYDGQLWVKHWQACGANLEAWIAYAEQLQQHVNKCKKFKGINLPRSR